MKAATAGWSSPDAAIAMPTRSTTMVPAKFCQMTRRVHRAVGRSPRTCPGRCRAARRRRSRARRRCLSPSRRHAGLGQGRRVVHAIADHRNHPAARRKCLTLRELRFGKGSARTSWIPSSSATELGHRSGVASEQDPAQARCCRTRRWRPWPQAARVADRDAPGNRPSRATISRDGGFASPRSTGTTTPRAVHQRPIADERRCAVDHAMRCPARRVIEALGFFQRGALPRHRRRWPCRADVRSAIRPKRPLRVRPLRETSSEGVTTALPYGQRSACRFCRGHHVRRVRASQGTGRLS